MKLYSNEIVFRGHPDKVCDQISGALLRAYMDKDRDTRAGIEVMGGKGKIFVTGEVTSKAKVNVPRIVKRVLDDCGYDKEKYEIIDNLGVQSADIALGTNNEVGGAGDQGMMFGYATKETDKYLPKAMVILQEFAAWYAWLCDEDFDFLSDGKAQITGIYDDNFNLVKIKTFLVSYQNRENHRPYTDGIIRDFIQHLCKFHYNVEVEEIIINPTGKFLIGGFDGDAGLTGRKIQVDAYQSFANVGGGCMNGKDPSKVDFSAAHKARQLAVRFVDEYDLRWCEVQLSYAIGLPEPLAIYVDSNKGNIEVPKEIYKECTPARIIEDLKLKDLDYEKLAMFGHFREKTQILLK
jgi:S-adenosylmethionine synthetase